MTLVKGYNYESKENRKNYFAFVYAHFMLCKKNKIKHFTENSAFIYTTLLFLCIAILLQSPLAPYAKSCIGNDSAIFITIARNILFGDILFLDVADHKGPMIFFMDALGLWLGQGNIIGIWILEVISLFIASVFTYRTALLLTNYLIAVCATTLSILFITPILLGGNLTELWTLPFISISLFIFTRYLSHKNTTLSFFNLFTLSFCFMIALLFKASYIAIWCAFGSIIAIKLIQEHKSRKLMKYLLCIFISCLITLLPFLCYFHFHNALHDALYWMFQFNIQYAHSDTISSTIGHVLQILLGIRHLPLLVPLCIGMIFLNGHHRKNRYLIYGYLCAIILTAYSCAIGSQYEHYNIIFAPLLVYFYTNLFNLLQLQSFKQRLALLIIVLGSGYIFIVKQLSSRNYNDYFISQTNTAEIKRVAQIIQEHSEPDDLIMRSNNINRAIYVYANRKCGNRCLSNAYHYNLWDEIKTKQPKIIVHNKEQGGSLQIAAIDSSSYHLIQEYGSYEIWGR